MNKNILMILLAAHFSAAQSPDSLYQPRASFEVRFGAFSDDDFHHVDPSELQKISDHPALAKDYGHLQRRTGFYRLNYSSLFYGANYYRTLRAHPRMSWSAGAVFRQMQLSSVYFDYDTLFVIDTLRGGNSAGEIVQYYHYNESVSFGVTGLKLYLPLALHWSTDPDRVFSLQAGVSLAPTVSFSHRINYDAQTSEKYLFAAPGERPDGHFNSLTQYIDGNYVRNRNIRSGGTGLGGYLSVPVAVYLRLSKRDSFYGRLRLMVGAETGYAYHGYRSLPAISNTHHRLNAGLKCRL